MGDHFNCPVCEKECKSDEIFCSQCGWELEGPLILYRLSSEGRKNYQRRLGIARQRWEELVSLRKSKSSWEDKSTAVSSTSQTQIPYMHLGYNYLMIEQGPDQGKKTS